MRTSRPAIATPSIAEIECSKWRVSDQSGSLSAGRIVHLTKCSEGEAIRRKLLAFFLQFPYTLDSFRPDCIRFVLPADLDSDIQMRISADYRARKAYKRSARVRNQGVRLDSRALKVILEGQEHRCWYCFVLFDQQSPRTLEHLIPICDEGTNEIANLVYACLSCNIRKNGASYESFSRRVIKEVPPEIYGMIKDMRRRVVGLKRSIENLRAAMPPEIADYWKLALLEARYPQLKKASISRDWPVKDHRSIVAIG